MTALARDYNWRCVGGPAPAIEAVVGRRYPAGTIRRAQCDRYAVVVPRRGQRPARRRGRYWGRAVKDRRGVVGRWNRFNVAMVIGGDGMELVCPLGPARIAEIEVDRGRCPDSSWVARSNIEGITASGSFAIIYLDAVDSAASRIGSCARQRGV